MWGSHLGDSKAKWRKRPEFNRGYWQRLTGLDLYVLGIETAVACGTGTGVPAARGFRVVGWRCSCRCLLPQTARFSTGKSKSACATKVKGTGRKNDTAPLANRPNKRSSQKRPVP